MFLHVLLYDLFFFFNDTATTEIYTLSLHDALPILAEEIVSARVAEDLPESFGKLVGVDDGAAVGVVGKVAQRDRKSTRLNSSHGYISYAVFCLKKKKKI